eukprot:scaffold9492_cov108-Isochrysis_galbana.AAC.4
MAGRAGRLEVCDQPQRLGRLPERLPPSRPGVGAADENIFGAQTVDHSGHVDTRWRVTPDHVGLWLLHLKAEPL